jgi:hypothetical protein
MAETTTTAPSSSLKRVLSSVDALFFLALGLLAVAIGIAISLR